MKTKLITMYELLTKQSQALREDARVYRQVSLLARAEALELWAAKIEASRDSLTDYQAHVQTVRVPEGF